MKKVFLFLFFGIINSSFVFSQETAVLNSNKLFLNNNKLSIFNYRDKNIEKINKHDWFFSPVTLHIHSGILLPLGKMSEYFNPCFQMGFGVGLMISGKVRVEYTIVPKFLKNKKEISIIVNDTAVKTNNPSGASIGGIVLYDLYKNKNIFLELFSGFAWESLDTEIKNPRPKNSNDKMLYISTVSFSFGLNTWINVPEKHNAGIRTIYNYGFFNRDKILISEIGGHSISFGLIYMFPERSDADRRYY